MPWHESKPISGKWGYHWTMRARDPDKIGADGRREIASNHYPLLGPYDNSDPHVLECHTLWMALCGIDGVIVDWYGVHDFWDYAMIHRNTEKLFEHTQAAKLRFAICYEDQTIGHMIDHGALTKDAATSRGIEVIQWLYNNWFNDPTYLTMERRPALFVFGPQYYNINDWRRLRAAGAPPPFIISLPHGADRAEAEGIFAWPPVHDGGTVAPESWKRYLHNMRQREGDQQMVVPAAFTRFDDYYNEARVQEGYGVIDDRDGDTLIESLAIAQTFKSPVIQLVTWNDFGEGTQIEPTREVGYRDLEIIQNWSRARRGPQFRYQPPDLELPYLIYQLRVAQKDTPATQRALDRIVRQIQQGELPEHRATIHERLRRLQE